MSISSLNARSSDLGIPESGTLPQSDQPCPETHRDTKNDRRFRVMRGHWMPYFEREGMPANATEDQKREIRERADALWHEAMESYPTPSSLLDVPPNAWWGNEDDEVIEPYTREEALQLVAAANRKPMESGANPRCMEWCNIAEILDHFETTYFSTLKDGHAYEERTARFRLRLVEPTAEEHERYGEPEFVNQIVGGQTT